MNNLLPEFRPVRSTGAETRLNNSVERIRAAPRSKLFADQLLIVNSEASSSSLARTSTIEPSNSQKATRVCSVLPTYSQYSSSNPSPLMHEGLKKPKSQSIRILSSSDERKNFQEKATRRKPSLFKTRVINYGNSEVDIFQTLSNGVRNLSLASDQALLPSEEDGLTWLFLPASKINLDCFSMHTWPANVPQVCSLSDQKKISIYFQNFSTTAGIKIFWINYSREAILQKILGPGEKYRVASYVSHPWLLVDTESGNEIVFILGVDTVRGRDDLSILWNPVESGITVQTISASSNMKDSRSNLILSIFPSKNHN